MGRNVLKVREDFHVQNVKEGDTIPTLYGELKILNTHYHNSYGEFILCEPAEEEAQTDGWRTDKGPLPNQTNRFEIIGTIHVPGYENLMAGIGYYVKDHETGETIGLSYQQAWQQVFLEGTRNAVASISKKGTFSTRLLDTIDDLPSLDSHYWRIPAYNKNNQAFAPLTKEVAKELKKGLRYASVHLANKVVSALSIDNHFERNDLEALKIEIDRASKIAVLTGAGVSTMSGIPDYRSVAFGIWRSKPEFLEQLNEATFRTNATVFWSNLYQLLRNTLAAVMAFDNHESLLEAMKAIRPNQTHQFLTFLEKDQGKDVRIITQNVDGLHQKAGNSQVIEFHGNFMECSCTSCGKTYALADVLQENVVPPCDCKGVLRPNVVFFGDEVKGLEEAMVAIEEADLVLVAGTSLQVYPFNGLLNFARNEAKVVFLNGEEPDEEERFDQIILGNLSTIFWDLKKRYESSKDSNDEYCE